MRKKSDHWKRLSFLATIAIAMWFAVLAQAQSRANLFRQRPNWTSPSPHGLAAYDGEADATAVAGGAAEITIAVPGQPDLEIERQGHERRGARSSVWRGRGRQDRSARMTLTQHDGLLFGRIESGNEVFTIRPGRNGRTIVEKLDPDSFAPEWGHETTSFGRDKVPPVKGDSLQQGSFAPPVTTSPDGTIRIDLMSVYTPQARNAGGGTAQIQGLIQAAVDQANTAFINSNMTARFFLAHTAEVSYNDSGNIENDLDWVTSNSTVASWRTTYGADLVSLVTSNGAGYCGIGWVQRNPGASFANYAFQVSALGCLSNQTLTHEHGHNMGMEHDPASAGVSPSGASYPWSFGHNVNGVFRTIMSYNVCSVSCPRVLHFSNPDVSYAGYPTGVAHQRDNANTGNLTAAIVAAFRSSGSGAPNNAPGFTSDPIVKPNGTVGQAYAGTLGVNASDADSDPLTFAKTGGPAWLFVASNGALAGTPGSTNTGINTFTVSVSDSRGGSDTATLQITVAAPQFSAPSNLVASANGLKTIDLTWSDNSMSETGFRIERSTNNRKFSHVATVGTGVQSYVNTRLRRGKTYYYRVRANGSPAPSGWSNTASARAN
jgi:peptidyl-Asp metalloendopeptidase